MSTIETANWRAALASPGVARACRTGEDVPAMADVPCYIIANFVVDDPDTYRIYEKGFFPILKRHGGEFFTFDDGSDTLEGATPLEGRIVLFTFPSEEAARAWYDDPDYQAISEHRRAGTSTRFLTLVHGLPPRT